MPGPNDPFNMGERKKEDIKRGNIKRVEQNRRPGSDFADGKMVHLALGVALPRVV